MELTPSFHGESCKYNGNDIAYEIACDHCDFFLVCFPDWESAHSAVYLETTIKTAPEEALETFLRANAAKKEITEDEIEIDLQVMEELYKRREARGMRIDAKAVFKKITHGQGLNYFLKR